MAIGITGIVAVLAGLLGCGVLIVVLIGVAWAISANRRSGSR